MHMETTQRSGKLLQFELSPVFCEKVRQQIEDINLGGGNLEFMEDMHPFRRTFTCQGNERDIVKIESFVQRLTAN